MMAGRWPEGGKCRLSSGHLSLDRREVLSSTQHLMFIMLMLDEGIKARDEDHVVESHSTRY